MDFYPSRKTKFKKISKKNRKRILLITNLWMFYLILISLLFIPNSTTYSNFNDVEQIAIPLATSADYCSDEEYKKKNHNECKEKDNSGIGNGPEDGDDGEHGDPDNPGKGNEDKKDCPPNGCVDDHPNNKEPKNPPKDNKENDKQENQDESEEGDDSETESEEPIDSGDNNQDGEADPQNNGAANSQNNGETITSEENVQTASE
jgi:hypothetical protein